MRSESGSRFRVLVVDDEPLARSTLRILLGQDPQVEICAECERGEEAVKAITALRPDILLLDIAMPGLNGFGVLEKLERGSLPVVIFSTAHDHAIRAFDVKAIDYLLKPYDDPRFFQALERAKAEVRHLRLHDLAQQISTALAPDAMPSSDSNTKPGKYLERLVVKDGDRLTLVPADQVDWIEAQDYYIEIHAAGKAHLLREPLRSLEGKLDPNRFVRIHRSTIVNLSRVKELQATSHGEYVVVLIDDHRLKMSRSYRQRLELLLGIG